MRLERIVGFLVVSAAALGQQASRGIVPEEVLRARPVAKTASVAVPRPGYQPVGLQDAGSVRTAADSRQVGVTVWRLRHAAASDAAGARILVQEDEKTVEWVPERMASGSRLNEGDRVRLSIESPDAGFLYVIDRERYASGERGAPWLIFPTSRTHGGDNRVSAGKLIDIPAQDDRPNFFTL